MLNQAIFRDCNILINPAARPRGNLQKKGRFLLNGIANNPCPHTLPFSHLWLWDTEIQSELSLWTLIFYTEHNCNVEAYEVCAFPHARAHTSTCTHILKYPHDHRQTTSSPSNVSFAHNKLCECSWVLKSMSGLASYKHDFVFFSQ